MSYNVTGVKVCDEIPTNRSAFPQSMEFLHGALAAPLSDSHDITLATPGPPQAVTSNCHPSSCQTTNLSLCKWPGRQQTASCPSWRGFWVTKDKHTAVPSDLFQAWRQGVFKGTSSNSLPVETHPPPMPWI